MRLPAPLPTHPLGQTASMEGAGDLRQPLITPVECLEEGADGLQLAEPPRLRHQRQHPSGLQYYQIYLRMVSALGLGCAFAD